MTKRYLKTPEEVVDALKAGKKIEAGDFEYRLVGEVLIAINKTDKSWAVNAGVYSDDIPFIDEPEPLKLEVGKFYKTRDGRKAWIVEGMDMKGSFPFRVATQRECNTYIITKDGRRYFEDTDGTDLVAPWEE